MSKLQLPRVVAAAVLGLGLSATAAQAQYRVPASSAVVGEKYNLEVSYNFWKPTPVAIVNSEALGILGTDVNLVDDLGIEKHYLKDLRIVLRPAKKHRFRIKIGRASCRERV